MGAHGVHGHHPPRGGDPGRPTYIVHPAWSHRLNADFEDHAEHEYMEFVAAHPELEQARCTCTIAPDYGTFDSFADVLRRIGLDEREHKMGSIAELATIDRRRHRRVAGVTIGVAIALAATCTLLVGRV